MQVAVIGTGYVGLVSGACLSEFGHRVVCIDKDVGKIAALRAGRMPIYEPGLEGLVAANVRADRLHFSNALDSVQQADAVFIAVGTPSRRGDGHADLQFVFQAAEEIAPSLKDGAVVITKSTVPVGTSRKVFEIVRKMRPDVSFDIASNPEFLREGSAIEDFRRPDRIIVGCESAHARDVLRAIYRPLYLNRTPMEFVSPESAELIKYAANAFLATKVTFINEMADLCEKVGADVQDVARGIGLDRRIGPKFLHAGPGYGGSCFPKDTLALVKTAQEAGAPSRIVEAVVAVNEARKAAMAERIVEAFGSVNGKTLAILGLTFKPNTDDMREAPSLVIVPHLRAEGATIRAYDPQADRDTQAMLGLETCRDAYDALDGADGVVLLTEWNEFRALDLARMRTLLKQPLMIDLRNIYHPAEMAAAGFRYVSLGRRETALEN